MKKEISADNGPGNSPALPPELFPALLDKVADSVHILDGQGRILYVNDAVCRATGYERAELIGKSIGIMNPPEDAALVPERIGKIAARGEARYELTHARKDGSRFPVEAYARVIELQGRKLIVAIDRDITERRKYEEELKLGNTMLAAQQEVVPDGLLMVDASGKIVFFNRNFARMWGLPDDVLSSGSDERALGHVLDELEDPEGFLAKVKYLYSHSGETSRDEVRLKDGRVFDRFSAPVAAADGKQFGRIWSFRDVTEDKRLERELAASEARYKTIYLGSRDALVLYSPERGFFDGNDATFALFNCTREQFRKLTPADLSPERQPDGRLSEEKAREIVALAMEKGGHSFEWRHRKCSGEEFDATVLLTRLTLDGRQVLHATVRDVTEMKKASAERREGYEIQAALNKMLHRSLETSPLSVKLAEYLEDILRVSWLSVEAKGAIFLLEGGALKLTVQRGLSPELVAKCDTVPLGRCLCGRAAASAKPLISACLGPEHEIGYYGMHEHGHCCVPIIAGGETLGVLNLYLKADLPITPKQEEFLKVAADVLAANIIRSRIENQLLQSQKMESIGRLAGGVAHDFNNILTAIKFYAEQVRKAMPPGDQKRDDAAEILSAADRAVSLTRQLLAVSRRQVMTPKVADLNVVTADMLNMLSRLIGEHIELKTDLSVEPCLVKVDTGQIEQVVMNLAVNARDAMPDGGTIRIETAVVEGTAALFLTHPELPRGRLVRLKISDNGSGMKPEVMEHIFEPFFTTKEQGKGTGLGLSTVFGIIKQSGGEVEVESLPGSGTTFSIYLAYSGESCAESGAAGNQCALRPASGEAILLVEDEDSLRRIGERVMAAAGYEVLAVSGAAAALKALRERGKPVDLLVTDVVMPGMGGRELALEAQRLGLAPRVLYMSGYADDAVMRGGATDEGIAFIYKPFSVDALLRKMREVLDGPADKARA
ncbi:MAG: PAS domain S-box protein [Elusimicrobiales bacterium]|nr:PAS domain S-box protein [Elusimicrobiales bacterium]